MSDTEIAAVFCPVCQIAGTQERAMLGKCWGGVSSRRRAGCPLPEELPPLLHPNGEPIAVTASRHSPPWFDA
jgi:hypothetical protein